MDDWSQSNQVVILINLLWPMIVYNDTLFIIVWVISKVKFEDGHFPRDSHSWRWCYICEVWSLKMFWPIYVFSLYLWILFYQPFYPYKWPSCPLKISMTMTILKKVLPNITFLFTYYYLFSFSSLIFLKIEKKITYKTLSINMNFPATRFHSLPCP